MPVAWNHGQTQWHFILFILLIRPVGRLNLARDRCIAWLRSCYIRPQKIEGACGLLLGDSMRLPVAENRHRRMGQTRPSLGSNVVRNAPIGLQMAQERYRATRAERFGFQSGATSRTSTNGRSFAISFLPCFIDSSPPHLVAISMHGLTVSRCRKC